MKRHLTKNIVCTTGAKGRVVATLMIGATLALGLASAALAQGPLNDEQSTATFVEDTSYTDTIDTTEATTAPDDFTECGQPSHSVWYSFTPSNTTFIGANTFGSAYDTILTAYVMDVEGLVQIACNDDAGSTLQSRVRFEAQAGVNYLFMVGSNFSTGSPGGSMTFNLINAPPSVQIDLAIDPRGTFSRRSNTATVRGTVTCTGSTDVLLIVRLNQRAGRFFNSGFDLFSLACDGRTSLRQNGSAINHTGE